MVNKRQSTILPDELATNLLGVYIRVKEENETSAVPFDNEIMHQLKIEEKRSKKRSVQERSHKPRN
ncbi:MAG: hypothetical protein ACYCQJ_03450 [Nitrososphaerales archaeon]